VALAYGRDPAPPSSGVVLPPMPQSRIVERAPVVDAPAARGPVRLSDPDGVSTWAPVLGHAVVRARPAAGARAVARLGPLTPERTTNAVLLVQRVEIGRRLWIQVRLPILPNNTLGWVPRAALGGYHRVATHLVVDREHLTATLTRSGKVVFRAPVGVGAPGSPTPRGEFYVRNELTRFASPFYGPIAFGTSARSAVLTDWPAGGFVGIHGTNEPGLIPGRISHGCIRLRNADILRLARLMKPGTPLTIR
jgi:L,D-transpeptidase-like protein